MDINKVYRLRASVALINLTDKLEMFKTNIRESLTIQINFPEIIELLLFFDGTKETIELLEQYPTISKEELSGLLNFLNKNAILIEVDEAYPKQLLNNKYRIINLLEDYCEKTSEVLASLREIEQKTVMIIGLGAVGTWVADTLARSGVNKFILVDDDIVDETNLHRQDFYFEQDIGLSKIDCIEKHLINVINPDIQKIHEKIDDHFFDRHQLQCDLVINCADYPSVDYTTEIVGKACMQSKTPHLIGGGYNLHLSLIGQTVLPGETACVKCFESYLNKINQADLNGVQKLHRPNRKIGSFGPVCALSASLTSTEAFKILINKYQYLTNTNKRIEFRIQEQDFFIQDVPKIDNCEWCGSNGLFA